MYVRKKLNKSGIVSIQVLEKIAGKSTLVKTVGSSSVPTEIEALYIKGRQLITALKGQTRFYFDKDNEEQLVNLFFNYDYIIRARIKNETKSIEKQILSAGLKNGESITIVKNETSRIIISYSDSRAKKDAANRKRGFEKLEKNITKGKLTKQHINNRGYNKYLKLEGDVKISIDKEKYQADAKTGWLERIFN